MVDTIFDDVLHYLIFMNVVADGTQDLRAHLHIKITGIECGGTFEWR